MGWGCLQPGTAPFTRPQHASPLLPGSRGRGVSGLDPLPRELTASKSAGGSRGSTRKEWRPASPGFLQEALHLLAQARVRIKMGGLRQPPSILYPIAASRQEGWRGRSGGLPGALRARASSRHTKSPGQGSLSVSSLPPWNAPPSRARPGPGFPQCKAEPPRPLPRGTQRGGLPTFGPPPTPAARSFVLRPGMPRNAYLALNLLHHLGSWGSDERPDSASDGNGCKAPD